MVEYDGMSDDVALDFPALTCIKAFEGSGASLVWPLILLDESEQQLAIGMLRCIQVLALGVELILYR